MGRSMITLSYKDFDTYNDEQKKLLKKAFGSRVISVYSENHPKEYPLAISFYNPKQIIDLCDKEVYPNGIGHHFEKRINFEIYKPHKDTILFKHLFLGTNERYYKTVQKYVDRFPDHGILTYDEKYVNIRNNNIFVPVTNLMGLFETYVYTKDTFDPAPRIIQECKYFNKDIIYLRDNGITDGGSVYFKRDIQKPDVAPILDACNLLKEGNELIPVNEYKVRNFQNKGLNIENTALCTLLCSKCKRATFLKLNGGSLPGKDLKPEQFKKIVGHFRYITFGGQLSDPIFGKHLLELLQICYENNTETRVLTTATSKKHNRDWYKKAFETNPDARWTFGIDGPPHLSHNYRVNQDGEFLFDMMCMAKEMGLKVHWQYIIFPWNAKYLKECKQKAKELDIKMTIIVSERN